MDQVDGEANAKSMRKRLARMNYFEMLKLAIDDLDRQPRGNSTAKRIEATTMVNADISGIPRGPNLTDEEKHPHTRCLLGR